jgi:hypothetical protein
LQVLKQDVQPPFLCSNCAVDFSLRVMTKISAIFYNL